MAQHCHSLHGDKPVCHSAAGNCQQMLSQSTLIRITYTVMNVASTSSTVMMLVVMYCKCCIESVTLTRICTSSPTLLESSQVSSI